MASLPKIQIPVGFYATQDDDSGVHQYAASAERGHFIRFEAVGCQSDSLLQGVAEYQDLAGVQEKKDAGLRTGLQGLEDAHVGVASPAELVETQLLRGAAADATGASDLTAAASDEGGEAAEIDASSDVSSSSNGSDGSSGSSCSPEQVEFVLVDQGVLLNMLLDPDALGATSNADSTQEPGLADAISREGQEVRQCSHSG